MNGFSIPQLPYFAIGYLVLTGIVALLCRRAVKQDQPPIILKLCVILAVCAVGALPLIYRVIPTDTPFLPWECETVLTYVDAYGRGLDVGTFAEEALKTNQGLLSSSGKSLLFGIPTYELMDRFGWSRTMLRLLPYLFGLVSLALGFLAMRGLFSRAVALLFVAVVATNPILPQYMGYGVSQTATLCGFVSALALIVLSLKSASRARYAWAAGAALALLLTIYNYAPGRIYVLATLGFLVVYGFSIVRTADSSKSSRATALLIVALTCGLFFAQLSWNSWSSLMAVRGEQAFLMSKHTDQLAQYLGDIPADKLSGPHGIPLSIKVRFLAAVALERAQEFVSRYTPSFPRETYFLRGSLHGDTFPPYHGALLIPILIGFFASLRALRSTGNLLLLTIFVGGIAPLLLTNRVDNHRSFLLIVPLSAWAAQGLWLLLRRLRGGWLAEAHCGLIVVAVTASMMATSWFFVGAPEKIEAQTTNAIEHIRPLLNNGASVIPVSLNCQTQAAVSLELGESKRRATVGAPELWEPEFGGRLLDERFRPESNETSKIIESASRAPVVVLSGSPLSQFMTWAKTAPLTVTEERAGPFLVLVLRSSRGAL